MTDQPKQGLMCIQRLTARERTEIEALAIAVSLYESCGFEKVATYLYYRLSAESA